MNRKNFAVTALIAAVAPFGFIAKANASTLTALNDFKRFVTDAQHANYYSKWASQNPYLAAKWYAFRDGILAGKRPAIPDMGTNYYGRSLVDAGIAYLNATAAAPTPTPTVFSAKITGNAAQGSTLTASIS